MSMGNAPAINPNMAMRNGMGGMGGMNMGGMGGMGMGNMGNMGMMNMMGGMMGGQGGMGMNNMGGMGGMGMGGGMGNMGGGGYNNNMVCRSPIVCFSANLSRPVGEYAEDRSRRKGREATDSVNDRQWAEQGVATLLADLFQTHQRVPLR